MNKILVLFIFLLPNWLLSQYSTRWVVCDNDTLEVRKYFNYGLNKSTAQYTNGQFKYKRKYVEGQIQDTISYFSKEGIEISKVYYKTLEYDLFDMSYHANYEFTDSIISIVEKKIKNNFDKEYLDKYVFIDVINSYQMTSDGFSSALYEPVKSPLEDWNVILSSRVEDEGNYVKSVIQFRIEKGFQIKQSNIDLDREYIIEYDRHFADSIRLNYNFNEVIDFSKKRGIRIYGPYLEFRNKDLYWVITRHAGKIFFENFNFMEYDNYQEEISINVESGQIQKIMKFVGTVDCY